MLQHPQTSKHSVTAKADLVIYRGERIFTAVIQTVNKVSNDIDAHRGELL